MDKRYVAAVGDEIVVEFVGEYAKELIQFLWVDAFIVEDFCYCFVLQNDLIDLFEVLEVVYVLDDDFVLELGVFGDEVVVAFVLGVASFNYVYCNFLDPYPVLNELTQLRSKLITKLLLLCKELLQLTYMIKKLLD